MARNLLGWCIVSNWPSNGEVVARLQHEAGASAMSLGHSLTGWSPVAGRASSARCTRCGDIARVMVRSLGSAPVQGPATQVRCTGGGTPDRR